MTAVILQQQDVAPGVHRSYPVKGDNGIGPLDTDSARWSNRSNAGNQSAFIRARVEFFLKFRRNILDHHAQAGSSHSRQLLLINEFNNGAMALDAWQTVITG